MSVWCSQTISSCIPWTDLDLICEAFWRDPTHFFSLVWGRGFVAHVVTRRRTLISSGSSGMQSCWSVTLRVMKDSSSSADGNAMSRIPLSQGRSFVLSADAKVCAECLSQLSYVCWRQQKNLNLLPDPRSCVVLYWIWNMCVHQVVIHIVCLRLTTGCSSSSS